MGNSTPVETKEVNCDIKIALPDSEQIAAISENLAYDLPVIAKEQLENTIEKSVNNISNNTDLIEVENISNDTNAVQIENITETKTEEILEISTKITSETDSETDSEILPINLAKIIPEKIENNILENTASEQSSEQAKKNCYHCGLEIPSGLNLTVEILSELRSMCCFGCQAVATCIVENGLTDYYNSREALPTSPRNIIPKELEHLKLYDNADFQLSFVKTIAENQREGTLLFDGITCSACVWLIEQQISKLPGVLSVQMNYVSKKAKICWDETKVKLSDILQTVEKIGYQAHPYDIKRRDALANEERKNAIWRIWVAGFAMMQVMMYAFPSYMTQDGELSTNTRAILNWAAMLLTIPVMVYSARPFFTNSWRDIKNKRLGMDVPVALGIATTFIWSVGATILQSGQVYFDSIAMFVFFLLGGRYLEMLARQEAININESLARLQPDFACKIVELPNENNCNNSELTKNDEIYPENFQFNPTNDETDNNKQFSTEVVAISKLAVGDKVLVKPGEIIPIDGTIIKGSSSIDESLLTGESKAVSKSIGDKVISGSINIGQSLEILINQIGEATRLSAILRLMDRAASEKPLLVQYADKLAGYFVGALLLIALMVGGIWLILAPHKALMIVVAVLVVTCPCALSLATPIALTVSHGVLAKKSLLITRANTIEALASIQQIVFDKTGTLTTGKLNLLKSNVFRENYSEQQILQLAYSLEFKSEHHLALAFTRAATAKNLSNLSVEQFENHPGQGVSGEIKGKKYRLGNALFIRTLFSADSLENIPQTYDTISGSQIYLADENGVIASFILGDTIRPQAKNLIEYLQQKQIDTAMFSGDNLTICQEIAKEIGINQVEAQLLPEGKYNKLCQLQANNQIVAMVGDGVNDAPTIAKAQVSIAMGGGTQIAKTQADVILLSDNLAHLQAGIETAQFTMHIIRQNMFWALMYNIIALPIAMVGLLSPGWAGIGMAGSSLVVVLNSLRIGAENHNIFNFIFNGLTKFKNNLFKQNSTSKQNINSTIKPLIP